MVKMLSGGIQDEGHNHRRKGPVGTYLVPRLVELGHEVVNIGRGKSEPYLPHAAWKQVQQVEMDRRSEEAAGTFGKHIADLEPDAVIDMICFTLESARHIVGALQGKIQHFLSCGTIWIHGYQTEVPAAEEQCRNPFGEYGVQKDAIERFLLAESRAKGFPATVLHPGHIPGPGHRYTSLEAIYESVRWLVEHGRIGG